MLPNKRKKTGWVLLASLGLLVALYGARVVDFAARGEQARFAFVDSVGMPLGSAPWPLLIGGGIALLPILLGW